MAHASTARYNDSAAVASKMDRRAISPEPPAASTAMSVSNKRKARDFESDPAGEETFINVVVRCRGRSEREVREDSNVVVTTEGAKGELVNLRTGPNASNNKTYNFDRVFSSAADQNMVFDDVVKPILDEVRFPW
jgi:kinesin family protein 11